MAPADRSVAGAAPPSVAALGGRFRYRLHVHLHAPTTVIGVLLAVLFTYLILAPIATMLTDAWRVQYGDERRIGEAVGSFTTYYFERAMASRVADPLFWTPLRNTISVALGAVAIALTIGGTLAWLLSRTDIYGRRWFSTALIVPYILPGWTFALAWMTLFKNRSVGGAPGWFEAVGLAPPDWLAYGQLPITMILGLHYAPFVILLLGNALRNLDSQLADWPHPRRLARRDDLADRLAACPAGARFRFDPRFRRVHRGFRRTLCAGPAGEFRCAGDLALPISRHPPAGVAGVLAATILLIGVISLMIDLLLLREARRFVTIGGKGSMERVTALDRSRVPATIFAGTVFVLSVVLPLAVLHLSTVMRAPGTLRRTISRSTTGSGRGSAPSRCRTAFC